jgi:hypothetical protein
MDMWWESQCRCFRGLKDRWNAQSVLDSELTSSEGPLANQLVSASRRNSLCRKVSDGEDAIANTRDACATRNKTPDGPLLRAFFQRIRFTAQKCERFAGEMEGTGDQDSFLRCPRGG